MMNDLLAPLHDPDEALEGAVTALHNHDLDEWELRLVQTRYRFHITRYRNTLRSLLARRDLPATLRAEIEDSLSVPAP